MIRVGITGQAGFVGTHLYNFLNLQKSEISTIPFHDEFFLSEKDLIHFVSQCDTIVHLAAMNRHPDPQTIYTTNIELVRKLISAIKTAGTKPHLLFSSSTQESLDNLYGKSKREGRQLLETFSRDAGACFTGLVIPNVFGPFGLPFYNSVVATFCHQLTHNQVPKIDVDKTVQLIYVQDLVKIIFSCITKREDEKEFLVPRMTERKVSDILSLLTLYKTGYFEAGIFPALESAFEIALFNTFRSYIDYKAIFPVQLKLNSDKRGDFVETIKSGCGGQVSFSTTRPMITRGNHFHTRKIERFAVIRGTARIQLRRIGTSEVLDLFLSGDKPAYVDMPVWYTHNITNTGTEDLFTIFWINELFNPEDPDTFFENV
jgi:UDP-2-acetamido-2,6-beta-L-arabino-hexul-4-ose reductase